MIIFAPTSRGVEPRTLITVASANGLSRSSVRKASDQISSLAIFTFPRFSPFRAAPLSLFHLFRVAPLSPRQFYLRCIRAVETAIILASDRDYTVELF